MYPVSEAFLQAVQQNTRRYYWTGKITTTAGAEYIFTQDDIVACFWILTGTRWRMRR